MTGALSSEDVFAAINRLEQEFPVAAWKSADIDLWPSYRFRLYTNAMNTVFANEPAPGRMQRLQGLARRGFRAVLRVPLAALRDLRHNDRVRPGTSAVFFTDGVSFVRLGEAWVDRVMDPVIEELAARGRRSFKLTPLAEAHVPRHVPSCFVQPTLDRIKLFGSRRAVAIEAPQFEALEAEAAAMLGAGATPGASWLKIEAARLTALAAWFGGVLARSGASHAFVNTYYSLEGLAFTRAARRLGMCAVDLQHGIQGLHHIAYGRWAAIPATGYSVLPQEFWVWSADEAENIDAWSACTKAHKPRVTGNFWLQRWKHGHDPLVADYLARARALRDSRPGTHHVLACLTWGVPEEENTKLVEAARLCGPELRWWWRLHPTQAARRDQFARLLESRGLDGSQVGLTTDLPLYALMSAADVTVAHSSTVIREAPQFGMRSVVTSQYGAEMHGELIQRGDAVLAIDVAAIADSVRSLASGRGAGPRRDVNRDSSLAAVLDESFGRGSA